MKQKMTGVIIGIFAFLVGMVISAPGALASEAGTGKVSRPFEYSGYSSPKYKSYVRSSQYVSMFDGTNLAVDIYLPSEGPADSTFPVLLNYHPYRRATIDPESGDIKPSFPNLEKFIKHFTSYGYAFVFADMRGSGASFGSRLDMSPQLAMDGKQLIDWIEIQPWCNGNVGTFGGSYMGWSQFAVAGQRPRALKAIMPEVINFDMFSGGLFYCGGIYNRGLLEFWANSMYLFDRAAYVPGEHAVLPAPPVVDEDGDRELADEIPLDRNKNSFFFDDSPPTYSDGGERHHIYYNAVKEHLNNLDPQQWAPAAPYRNSSIAGSEYTYTDLGPGDWPVRLSESRLPIYHVGAWFDIFTTGTTRWYATLKATNPSKILIHPSFHSALDFLSEFVGPYLAHFGESMEQVANGMLKERLRFFDRYLKGIKNGIDADPPVLIYVMNGEGWRSEDEWPLARQVVTNYYLEEGYALSKVKMTKGFDKYEANFTHDSRYGINNVCRGTGLAKPLDQPMKRTDKDEKCLPYTSKPLEEDTEVTGHPIARLWVSSTVDYGDFFVYLEDIDNKGEAYYVTEGKLRAGFAGLVPQEDILHPGAHIDVFPDLPYHGFKDTDYVDGIFAGGNVVELVIDLFPTSWVFKKGHRFRVSIACADWPTYDLHPRLSPKNDPSDPSNTVPTITVYRDAKHPSRIELPIIPQKLKDTVSDASFPMMPLAKERILDTYNLMNEEPWLVEELSWMRDSFKTGSNSKYEGSSLCNKG